MPGFDGDPQFFVSNNHKTEDFQPGTKDFRARAETDGTRYDNGHERGSGKQPHIPCKTGKDFPLQKIKWLWPGWLASGKLHVLAGQKGAGKSTVLFDIMARIARVSSDGKWPDDMPAPRGKVIIWSGEDGIEDTILPRFVAAGGDLDLVYPIKTVISGNESRSFDPSTDMAALMNLITQIPDLLLVVIDPVVLAMPKKSDSHNNAETRRGLQPLVDLADRHEVALIGITHFTKGTADRDPIERLSGSLAFGAIPRVVWGASADEDGRQRRLVRIASNIGPSGGGIEYTLFQAPLVGYDDGFFAQRVDWGPQLKGPARELLNATKRSAQAEAANFLTTFLANGPVPQREVKAAAEAHCHSWGTVRLAQKSLGIRPYQEGRIWLWQLPSPISTSTLN